MISAGMIHWFLSAIILGGVTMAQVDWPQIAIVHSAAQPVITDERPLGLQTIANRMRAYPAHVIDVPVATIPANPPAYDVVILYKLGEGAADYRSFVQRMIQSAGAVLVFEHPLMGHDDSFSQHACGIIEDPWLHDPPVHHQIVADYRGQQAVWVGLFPYSGVVASSQGECRVKTSKQAHCLGDGAEGPFCLIRYNASARQYRIANYLILTNYWIDRFQNKQIIDDMFRELGIYKLKTSQ